MYNNYGLGPADALGQSLGGGQPNLLQQWNMRPQQSKYSNNTHNNKTINQLIYNLPYIHINTQHFIKKITQNAQHVCVALIINLFALYRFCHPLLRMLLNNCMQVDFFERLLYIMHKNINIT